MPAYPPPRNAWEFPPPPVNPRWKWLAIAVSTFSVAAVIALVTVMITIADDDIPGLIDDAELVSVITQECDIMRSSVESMPIAGDARQQAAILADQNKAVENMVAAIREVDESVIRADRPAEDWLADWERLVAARESYADLVLQGEVPDLEIPRDSSGERIYLRMNDVWLDDPPRCMVPFELLNPYPEDSSDT